MRMTVAALLAALAAPAAAQDVSAANPDSVLQGVRAWGDKARLDTDEDGLPVIRARNQDINYSVYFYGCQGTSGCTQIQFAASFDLDPGLTAQFVNDWNEQWVVGRLSVNADGDPLFTYFVQADPPMSGPLFDSVMATWIGAMQGVVQDIGY